MPKNRYGDEYEFKLIDANTYLIEGDLKYWRYGGMEGEHSVNTDNLGMMDPSGGPYIALGMMLNGHPITRLYVKDDKHYVEVGKNDSAT